MGARTVLIVEDNAISRKAMRVALEAAGYAVLESADGRSALESVARQRPDLILQDILLPDVDGFELVQKLRALHGAEIPIIACTGFLSQLETNRLWSAAFDEVLAKPIEPSMLVQVVGSHLPAADPAAGKLGRGRRVLVADDDPVQLKLTRVGFTQMGFAVSVAKNGAEALELARADPPDAIVSDVLMPDMDGFQLCLAVRSDPRLLHVPVVLLTASYLADADRELARNVGANALLSRTPGMKDESEALLKSLDAGAPPLPEGRAGEVQQEHFRRVMRQLERQTVINMRLTQRCSLQGMMLSSVASLSDAMARRSDSESTLDEALHVILDVSGISRGALYLLEPDGALRLAASNGFSEAQKPALATFFGAEDVLRRGMEAGEVTSVNLPALPAGAADERAGPSSAVLVPLLSRGERVGALFFGSDTPRLLDEEWIAFARTMGTQLGQTIGLSRVLSRLVSSEERLRTLMENASDGIFVLNQEGKLLESNRAGEEMLGTPRSEMIGRNITSYFDREHVDEEVARFRKIAEGQPVRADDVQIRTADGRRRRVDFSTRLVEVAGEKLVLSIAHDVTERKRAEEEMRLLQTIAAAVSRAENLSGALEVVVRNVCEAAGWAYGEAWVPRDDGAVLVCTTTATRERSAAKQLARMAEGWTFAPGQGLPGRVWASKKPVWVPDVARDPNFPRSPLAAELGLRAVVAVPVIVSDQVIAVLEFFTEQPHAEDERLVEVVSTVATQIASVIQRRQVEEALHKSEEQLRQSQKMEAIGQLAGGIAHDFNNILTVILSAVSFLLDDFSRSDPRRADAEDIKTGAERAAELTRQLLAYSRRQVLEPRALDLNTVVSGLEKMLRRLIGEHIEFVTRPGEGLGTVKADAGQLEQVILNIVVNARDAMPQGGKLTIETANAQLDQNYAVEHAPVRPGPYAMLAISDTGTGMDAETQRRVFEPFFTTKEMGKGTGLGLSTVYGIVKQSGGYVWVYSEVGRGTVFKIYLPRVEELPAAVTQRKAPRELRGSETVLLVEDDEKVRAAAQRILESGGYQVLVARSAGEAIALCVQNRIDLLLTDVVMPGQSGPELARAVKARRPEAKVLFMSGYMDHSLVEQGEVQPGANLIQKPFMPETLSRKVRDALDG